MEERHMGTGPAWKEMRITDLDPLFIYQVFHISNIHNTYSMCSVTSLHALDSRGLRNEQELLMAEEQRGTQHAAETGT